MTQESGAPATGDNVTPSTPQPDEGRDWRAEYDKVLAQSRKWEERSKANAAAAKELETLRAQTMTDTERAVAEASSKARSAALAEVAGERVADAIRAAAAGRQVDVDVLLQGVDAAKFVNDDGQVDRDSVTRWVESIAPKGVPLHPAVPQVIDLAQGARGGAIAGSDSPILQAVRDKLGINA